MSRTVLVTGVTKGCGRALAVGIAERGHLVLGCGRTAAALDALGTEIGKEHDLRQVDVADDAAVASWAREVLSRRGAPDLLVNNAGRINRNAPLWEVPPDEFGGVVDVNVKGVYHVLRHFLPAMIERGGGVVVNVSSGWGRSTAPEVAPYCASKWAVEGLSRALAQEAPPGVVVVSLNPGIVDTEMLRSCFGGSTGSYPDPEAWAARAVPHLLSIGPEHHGQALTSP
jgi:NAD(P)-dependent dehydrogenase (short-subunit alcohol dehydrogenase family)